MVDGKLEPGVATTSSFMSSPNLVAEPSEGQTLVEQRIRVPGIGQ